MIRRSEVESARAKAIEYFNRAGIVLTPQEQQAIEVAEYDLGMFETIGLQLLTYFNTGRASARELFLLPGQTCPEHYHPPFNDECGANPGKEETFRCRYGTVYLYVDGEPAPDPAVQAPQKRNEYFTASHEIVLNAGDQYTLVPGTKHWFRAGGEGAIVSEFSTRILDEADVFTDPEVKRFSVILD